MSSQSDTPETDRPVEDQGLPTSPVDDDQPGRSFRGDEPDAGAEGSYGTKADDADPDEADAAREADDAGRTRARASESIDEDQQQSYGDDPTARDAPPPDEEQPIQNPDSPLGRQLD